MSFRELAQAIATSYKNIDDVTKAWLDDTSAKLLAHNKEMRTRLSDYMAARGIKEPEEEKKEVKKNAGSSDAPKDPLPASGRASPGLSYAEMDERRKYLLKLQAAKLSLEMQELQNAISPAGMRHDNFMMMYPGASRAGAIDRYGLSPYVNHLVTPREPSSILAMANGGVGSLLPPFYMRPGQKVRDVDARSQSLLRREDSPKRKAGNEATEEEAKRDEKRTKIESQEKPSQKAKARSQSNSPLEEARDRAASLGGMYPPSSVLSRDGLASAFHTPYSSMQRARAGLSSYGAGGSMMGAGFGGAPNGDQLMLGYQLGLQAAAKAQAESSRSPSRRMSHEEMAMRLQAMDEGLSPKNKSSNRNDDVEAQLEVLKRREMLNQLDRAETRACSSRRLSNEEIAARLGELGRHASPSARDEEMARIELLRRPGMDRADNFTRNEFGLSLSEIEKTFSEMKQNR